MGWYLTLAIAPLPNALLTCNLGPLTPSDPVWCPYLLLPRAALTLKAFLLLQPWSGTFTMDITQVYVPALNGSHINPLESI